MEITRQVIVLDAADLGAVSRFWAAVLGGEVAADEDWHGILIDGVEQLAVQHAPDHRPPDWPDGAPQQMHLDFYVADVAGAHAHVMDCGARLLQDAPDRDAERGFIVYADPAGHPFCLCWG